MKEKVHNRFPKQVVATLLVSTVVMVYPLIRYGSADIIRSVVVGALLSTANVLLGYFAIVYSLRKSYSTFVKMVLGGMGVRMAVLLVALVILIKLLGFHAVALTTSMLVFYVIYLILEVLFIQKVMIVSDRG